MNWRPIDTAPKDGTRFLAVAADGEIGIVSRHDPGGQERNLKHNYECWVTDFNSPRGLPPTHWMPLPKAPDPADLVIVHETIDLTHPDCPVVYLGHPKPDVLGYATRLATALWERHWKDEAPDWKPLPDLMGLLTQIDNATAGLIRDPSAVGVNTEITP